MTFKTHDLVIIATGLLGIVVACGGTTGCSTGDLKPNPLAEAGTPQVRKGKTPSCCAKGAVVDAGRVAEKPARAPHETVSIQGAPAIPDVELMDQYGKPVRFYSELVQGKTVAISFFFTSCTTICPPLTATMTQVQELLKKRGRDDVEIISISVDPVTDTPTRLRAWSKNYNAQRGWTFLTGKKSTVDKLLKALKSFTPDPQDHSPMILVGNEPKGVWKQVYGLASASDLARAICDVAGRKPVVEQAATEAASERGHDKAEASPASDEAARNYFTDVELVDQNGVKHRLYSDLMKEHVVVISSFFASCTGVCPVLNQKLTAIRRAFPDHIGKDLFLLSISVDPLVDTPQRLKEYADSLEAGPGWLFLTGRKENVEAALGKLGMAVEDRESHSNILLIGNLRTGLWKKAFGLASATDLARIVDSVLNDSGEAIQ